MPRKRRSVKGITFTPFAEEQRTAFAMLVNLPGLKVSFDQMAREGLHAAGRGLLVWVSPNGKVEDLRPPVYSSVGEWKRMPLLVNTPHDDLLQAMITYNLQRSYIILVVAGTDDGQSGNYMWWIEPFAKQRGQSHPLLS
ncbi:MAG TPA: hypothetical protein VFU22_22805 [Roseiflexaceae bacterium]|nr:hypothetical protein [Roseiflexaceae bacterium]